MWLDPTVPNWQRDGKGSAWQYPIPSRGTFFSAESNLQRLSNGTLQYGPLRVKRRRRLEEELICSTLKAVRGSHYCVQRANGHPPNSSGG